MKIQPKTGHPNHRGKSTLEKRSTNGSKPTGKKRVRPLTAKQFVNIVEHVSDGLIVLDNDWHYVYVNQKAAEMLQRQRPLSR